MASKFQKSSLQYLKYLKFKYHQLFSHIFTGFSPQVQAEKEWHGLLPQRSQGICLKSWRSYWVAKVGLEKIQSRFGTLMMFGSTVMMLMPGSMDIMLVMMFMQMTLLRMMLLLMIMMRRPTSLHNRWSQADTVILYISVYIYIYPLVMIYGCPHSGHTKDLQSFFWQLQTHQHVSFINMVSASSHAE